MVGDGVKRTQVEELALSYGIEITITGYLEYADFLKYLSYADVAVNCFNKDTAVVHSYKYNDYILSGLAIMNSLQGETAEMIDRYKLGFNYTDSESLLEAFRKLYFDKKLLNTMKENSKYVAKEILSSDKIYSSLVSKIEKISSENM